MKLAGLLGYSSLITLAITSSIAEAQSSTETYSYDALGRLISVVTAGGQNNAETHSICYDDAGNRTQYVSDTSGIPASCTGGSPPPPPPPPQPAPSISVANGSASEGGSVTFSVMLSAAYSSSISVNYATAIGTAGTSDFQARSGTLTFAAGESVKSVVVPTIQDTLIEATETFVLNLSGATNGATIFDGQGIGSIYDDDELPDPGCGPYVCY